jgi:hypothetical protein
MPSEWWVSPVVARTMGPAQPTLQTRASDAGRMSGRVFARAEVVLGST